MESIVISYPSGRVRTKIVNLSRWRPRGITCNGERPIEIGISVVHRNNVQLIKELSYMVSPYGVGITFLENGMSLGKKMRMEVVEPVVEATEELAVLVDEALGDVDLPDVSSITGLGGGSEFVTILNEAAEVEVK